MLKDKSIAVVIPAYNEEKQIKNVIETIPDFVDFIIVINDKSTDKTEKIVMGIIKSEKRDDYISKDTFVKNANNNKNNKYNHAENILETIRSKEEAQYTPHKIVTKESSRIILINHLVNSHIGAALASGYRWCRDHNIDCTAIMAGDGQMDPVELKNICIPIVEGEVDYVKANRLKHRSAFFVIPKIRFFGNSILSLFTKIASGYWRVSDTQTGFTAISLQALKAIRIHKIYKNYGCPNDILVKLNIAYCTIKEIESKPIYNIGEKSKMNELAVVPKISWLLFKLFWTRLYVKYLFRDFHPLFLLYHLAFFLLLIDIRFLYIALISLEPHTLISLPNQIAFIFLTITGFQSLFFAMWMDMMDNERLQK
ncbi:glycosyl transferase family 2 [candidate division WWE3 bacterium RBG_19FT_COMBO_34_6]|uniref:Glycosyl transferase family 2 n=1 Tax=candidate division WWE3 bacterium RBG_19FT_COMBO_34_6 TaxID=1802612 RepID=A0A1F4UK92_UNCKA|nr:MAG: glycosyl transferase family 2 [candidate division WWE3 bacterium RBG_19FT_COMBO_34_6]